VRRDPWFQRTVQALENWGFTLRDQSGPDAEHFGNWILVAVGDNLALRIIRDRGHVHLDLMPALVFQAPEGAAYYDAEGNPIQTHPSESDWYNWDVVATALGIPFKPEIEPLISFQEYSGLVNDLFSPANWKQTKDLLAHVEEDKRRRFTEGRREERRVPAHA
jgi:hypothetical protein